MTLDSLPIILQKTISTLGIKHRSEAAYNTWLRGVSNYLTQQNPAIDSVIETYAINSNDPQQVRGVAYTLLTLINDQIEEDKRRGKK